MCTPNCSCLSCTVVFGQQLAHLLHTWESFSWRVGRNLSDILREIDGSTSALSQLQVLLESEKSSPTKIFKPAGHEEIETLTVKCNLIFKAVILLIQKAKDRKKHKDAEEDTDDDTDNSATGWSILFPSKGGKEAKKRSEDDDVSEEQKRPEEEKSDLLVGSVPSLTSATTMGLVGMCNGQWSWLEPRVEHCQTQLKWARKGLLLHLQMGRLTDLSNQGFNNEEGSFGTQVVFRLSVHELWKWQSRFVRSKARKEERAKERARRLQELRDKADTASIHSSHSDASDRTVVVDEPRDTEVKSGDDATEKKAVGEVVNTTCTPPGETPETGLEAKTVQPKLVCELNARPPIIVTPALPAPELLTKTDGSAQDSKDKTVGKLASGMHDMRASFSDTMAQWTHKIFGRPDEFSKDWESQELEAWVIQSSPPFSGPLKLPFGHQRLKYGLKRTRGRKLSGLGTTTFTRYIAGGPRVHVLLDEVTREANRLQSRERICLAHSEHMREGNTSDLYFLIAFFSICKEKAPIAFTDCLGRKMTLPFETCRTWEGMRANINEAFRHVPVIGPHVMEEHYDLANAKNEYIPFGLWENTIKPGDSIVMRMLPTNDHVLRGPFSPLPYGIPLRRASEIDARNARSARLRQLHMANGAMPFLPRDGFSDRGPGPMVHRGVPVMGGGGPPPMIPVPPPPPSSSSSSSSSSSATSIDEDAVTEAEKRELTFVDFVEQFRKTKGVTAGVLLAQRTELRDIFESLDDGCAVSASSGSDSDSSSTSGSGSMSW